ncbi:PRD domain-containing protein [Shouchella clausii]|nr:PRD domain-containing protein [Shouchella clausii]MCM3312929.1 PRD domain-containing protein [Psychrobacillus sp. MER TA 17]KKI87087.1 hypothetical protein WZ76_07470 [Shouchella clausii]MBX0319242.1 PRD domain-containing protein [Shouchella clausii]MDO7266309.1 PRD domain-containing protein [Shouchella clausii]MDO7286776.1 PRD domain-containing protein [Shouchella clausii]
MNLIKSFNNNIALVEDAAGLEWVVIGTGVGFNRKKGDAIDETLVTKKYSAESSSTHPFSELIDNIPVAVFEVAAMMIRKAETIIGVQLSDHLFLALADHLNYAIQRTLDGIDYPHSHPWELDRLYPKEHKAAKEAVRIVFDELDVLLPKSEESFLTYHFVNAQGQQRHMKETVKMTEVINRIVKIIEFDYELQLNEESFDYLRLLTHLRYFVLRQLHQEKVEYKQFNPELIELIQGTYKKAYQCATKIGRILHKQYGWELSSNEELYLTLHIWRLLY